MSVSGLEIEDLKDGDEKESVQDDDEDKKNPQYIPKKGMFYEHDNRYLEIEKYARGLYVLFQTKLTYFTA